MGTETFGQNIIGAMSSSTQWIGDFSKEALCPGSGRGIVVEGKVKSTRVHSVFISGATKPAHLVELLPTRFVACVVVPEIIFERMDDRNGDEVDYRYNLGKKGTKSYYEPKNVTVSELLNRVGTNGSPVPSKLLEDRSHLHPNVSNAFEFWFDIEKAGVKQLEAGDHVQLCTLKDSIFVDKFLLLNPKNQDALTGGWADNLKEYEDAENKYINLKHESEVDDEEWSD